MSTLPHWNISTIYPSFKSSEYKNDLQNLENQTDELLSKIVNGLEKINDTAILGIIKLYESTAALADNLHAYAEAVYTTDTQNAQALQAINELEEKVLPLKSALVKMRSLLASAYKINGPFSGELAAYGFFIDESLKMAAHQMEPQLEELANDLQRSGAACWTRLHESLTANTSAIWEEGGDTSARKTITELRSLAFSPERAIRQKAYTLELEAAKSIEIPMAAALNGIKGTSITLNMRRKWDNVFEKSAFQMKFTKKTLDVLIKALESSLPMFKKYFSAKARALKLEKLAFFDLFAPVSGNNSQKTQEEWDFEHAKEFIVGQFNVFDPKMAEFARKAYENGWVDAEPRAGKIGGAYCTDFPLKGESRILCNFDGTFDALTTLAHETGHAWHHEVIKDLPFLQSQYPMTLAETASIFAETLVFEGAMKTLPAEQKAGILETSIKDAAQVIVDILCRYYFEKEVFERRAKSELSPDDYCEIMRDCQKRTYGDALDERLLHPYMWALKIHYYDANLPFYNYPYAFGQLFSLSLYDRAKNEGSAFAKTYTELLSNTGKMNALDAAKSAGFDIESSSFYERGLAIIEQRIEQFCAIV